MAERRVSMMIDLDLTKYSKEAHAVTIEKIAFQVGKFAEELMIENGYSVRKAGVTTMLHYVRHTIKTTIRRAPKRLLKSV